MPLGWGTIKSKILNYYEYFDRIQENLNILKTTFEVHNFAAIYVEKKNKTSYEKLDMFMFRWLRFLFKKLYNKKTRCDLETVFYYAKKCNSSHSLWCNLGYFLLSFFFPSLCFFSELPHKETNFLYFFTE